MNRRRAAGPCHRIHDGALISGRVPRLPAYPEGYTWARLAIASDLPGAWHPPPPRPADRSSRGSKRFGEPLLRLLVENDPTPRPGS
jgi:hypothetical protein